jgi:sulfur-oxidizing protein SoxX
MFYKNTTLLTTIGAIALSLLINPITSSADSKTSITEGKALSLKFCQTCHNYVDTEQSGTVGPPLVGMKSRFPDRKILFNIIYDPQVAIRKDTMMPPFGRHELLAKDQIEKVIDFLYTL